MARRGLGGAGKTSVALEYADRRLGAVRVAWQLPAEDPAVLAAGFGELAALLPLRERVAGREHPSTLATRGDLAYWTGKAGDAAGARDQFAALLPIQQRVLGPEHPGTLITGSQLARWTGEEEDGLALSAD